MLETTAVRNDYVGNGTTADYDYTFKIFAESHLTVIVTDPDTGEETDLVLDVDYTVDIDGIDEDAGGTITLLDASQAWIDNSGFLDDDYGLAIIRNIPYTQTTDLRNQGDSFPENSETAFDKLVMMVQQLNDMLARSVKAPRSEDVDDLELPSADSRASKYLAFDADGAPVASDLVVDTALVTAFMQTLLDDTTAAQARTTLGFSGAGSTVPTALIEALAVTTAKINALAVTLAKVDTGLINDMTEVDPTLLDYVAIADQSDSGKIKKTLVSKLKNRAVRSITTTDPATAADETISLSSSLFTKTLSSAVDNPGKVIDIVHAGAAFVTYTIASAAGNVAGASSSAVHMPGEVLRVQSNGADWIKIYRYIPENETTYTPTGSWSSNTTYTGKYWRHGNKLNLDIKVAVTGAPTSASLTVDLPSGPVIDTANMIAAEQNVSCHHGTVSIRDAGTDNFTGFIKYNNTTSIAIFKDDGDGTESAVTQAAPMTFATGDYVHIKVRDLIIVGWNT